MPTPPPRMSKTEKETNIKDPFAKICESQALVSYLSCQKQITVPSHLFTSSCSGFFPLAIIRDSHFGMNGVEKGGFCSGVGRGEEGCLAGVRIQTSI